MRFPCCLTPQQQTQLELPEQYIYSIVARWGGLFCKERIYSQLSSFQKGQGAEIRRNSHPFCFLELSWHVSNRLLSSGLDHQQCFLLYVLPQKLRDAVKSKCCGVITKMICLLANTSLSHAVWDLLWKLTDVLIQFCPVLPIHLTLSSAISFWELKIPLWDWCFESTDAPTQEVGQKVKKCWQKCVALQAMMRRHNFDMSH